MSFSAALLLAGALPFAALPAAAAPIPAAVAEPSPAPVPAPAPVAAPEPEPAQVEAAVPADVAAEEPADAEAVASAGTPDLDAPVVRPRAVPAEPRVPGDAPETVASLSQPRIIDVDPGGGFADDEPELTDEGISEREMLMREFPDKLVEAMWIQDWTDIERAYQYGGLVDIRSDPEGRGIVLRLSGSSRIGELVSDAYRQALLCRLRRPAAGLLYRVAARMRMMEGESYIPLEITSLVRTWDYQLRLTDVNPNADRSREGMPPTHVLGMAFDIARSRMSVDREQRLEMVFGQLAAEGQLAYYKEGASNGLKHYHVMALPSAESELARYFDSDSPGGEPLFEAMARPRGLPDAPCVSFGSSLEPFSAICSCDVPFELSAAPWNAPISR